MAAQPDNTIRTIAHNACTGCGAFCARAAAEPLPFPITSWPTRPLRARRPFCPPRRLAA